MGEEPAGTGGVDEDFAVILLDVQMPEMDGFETASLIRARATSQHIPIILRSLCKAFNREHGI